MIDGLQEHLPAKISIKYFEVINEIIDQHKPANSKTFMANNTICKNELSETLNFIESKIIEVKEQRSKIKLLTK